MNLSFAGCGFLGIYHVGVAAAFRTYVPQMRTMKVRLETVCCLPNSLNGLIFQKKNEHLFKTGRN